MNSLTGIIKGNEFQVINLGLKDIRAYLLGFAFVVGNIVLPWTCHQFALGGSTFLPIYFFALIAGYKFGYKVGLLTALASPLANLALTGMPPAYILPIVMLKSSVLAISAALVANYSKKISLLNLFVVVVSYQILTSAIVFVVTKDHILALSDFIIGYPGLLVQIFGGYSLLTLLNKKND